MVATVSNTKSYFVGPQDGWVLIVDATTTNLTFLRLAAAPKEQAFYVFAGTTAPTATSQGNLISCHPFETAAYTNGNASKFWVKVPNVQNSSQNSDGRTRIDAYADGGVLQ